MQKNASIVEWPITFLSPFTVFWSYLSGSNEKMQYTVFSRIFLPSGLPHFCRLTLGSGILSTNTWGTHRHHSIRKIPWYEILKFHVRKEEDGVKDFVTTVLMLQ